MMNENINDVISVGQSMVDIREKIQDLSKSVDTIINKSLLSLENDVSCVEKLNNLLDAEMIKNNNMQNQLDIYMQEKVELTKEIERQKSEIKDKEEQLFKKNNDLDEINKSYNEEKVKYEKLAEEFNNEKNNKEALQKEVADKEQFIKDRENEFNNAISNYAKIFKCMVKCNSMKSLVEDVMGINSTEELSINDAVVFANYVGRDFGFARSIVNRMDEYKHKAEEPEFLTKDEINLIRTINEYYRDIENKDFDRIILS